MNPFVSYLLGVLSGAAALWLALRYKVLRKKRQMTTSHE